MDGIGVLTGGVGANLAKASGVEYVTAMNFYKNTGNTIGKKYFMVRQLQNPL